MRVWILSLVVMPIFAPITPAWAASFDCAKATTPFEHAICVDPGLSMKDEVMAKAFATALGGLSQPAEAELRDGQRDWLAFAQASCTNDARLLTTGSYDEDQRTCLAQVYDDRTSVLESSRMISGMRFYPQTHYAVLPDVGPDASPDFPTATYDAALAQVDGSDTAGGFNRFMVEQGAKLSGSLLDPAVSGDLAKLDATVDVSTQLTVTEVTPKRISGTILTYQYNHGGAHGGSYLGNFHYMREAGRGLVAADLFKDNAWQKRLLDLSVKQLTADLGDALMLDDPASLQEAVVDPERWRITEKGLEIQFEQYEVSAYANGAPTVTLPWNGLEDVLRENYYSLL